MSDSNHSQDRKIVLEFCHLLEKSKQSFNGLRDLPLYGHKQWDSYFQRTFDAYTRLWKFQQQHRDILDCKYGLKRWQIGEIASKIGQIYYHLYLRTSDPTFLNDAYSFYLAIRGRSYYTRASKEDRCDLMVKKLRYYARFIVVCILLKKMNIVKDLIIELDRQIIDYGNTYDPEDQIEWNIVLEEVKSFILAESIVTVTCKDSAPINISHRLTPHLSPPVERSSIMNLTLQKIVIIGSMAEQVKFSELTMDMFRILQTLEREPRKNANNIPDDESSRSNRIPVPHGASSSRALLDGALTSNHPHKYLLYKPSISQIMVYLGSGCKELPVNGALLLYVSADGSFSSIKHPENYAYDFGGVVTNSKRDPHRELLREGRRGQNINEQHCLYPGDLYPFTRRPMFIIIESDNSLVFQNVPRLFGQPLVILMSPSDVPQQFHAHQHEGSLFTLFLHSPLTGFCYCCDIKRLPLHMWERSETYVDKFLVEASEVLLRSRIDQSYLQFYGDDFLRLLLLRYVFCDYFMRLHRAFSGKQYRPKAVPALPETELLEHTGLAQIILDLAEQLEVRSLFKDMELRPNFTPQHDDGRYGSSDGPKY